MALLEEKVKSDARPADHEQAVVQTQMVHTCMKVYMHQKLSSMTEFTEVQHVPQCRSAAEKAASTAVQCSAQGQAFNEA